MPGSTVSPADIVVAGHVCLDLIPSFPPTSGGQIKPGTLVQIGASTFSSGGVSNTAVALHRLGVPTKFIGKIGDDQFGAILGSVLSKNGSMADGLVIAPGETTSYSYVINPPGIDRTFLHCPGANDTFTARDVPYDALRPARFFHFGYPPVMAAMRANNGATLRDTFERVKGKGLVTSLDLTLPDPSTPAGQMDWRALFANVAPHLDIFLPSIDELLLMLDRPRYLSLIQQDGRIDIARRLTLDLVRRFAEELLEMGIGVVVVKLGDQGLYLRSAGNERQIKSITSVTGWVNREMLAPCFEVKVAGTTGAGDCTIAGFLAAMLRGDAPKQSMIAATAVGACCVEQIDATSGVRPWDQTLARILAGWPQRPLSIAHAGWTFDESSRVYVGPADGKSSC